MLSLIREQIRLLKDYNKLAKIDRIARRYFVMNSFDGALAMMGLLVGSYVADTDARIVLSTGIGVAIAMGVSGIWGAYLTEKAERAKEIRDLESATLTKLKGTKIGRAAAAAVIIITLIDGIAPALASMMILSPFFLLQNNLELKTIYTISIAIGFFILFILGAFLGKISKENMLKGGLFMILAGVASAAISLMLLGTTPIP